MKLRYFAALTFLCWCFQLGQSNALGWKQCYSQAQCGPEEFCGVVQNQPVGNCQTSDSWPLTPAPTTDSSTGVYGYSVFSIGGGAFQVHPPNWTPPPEPDISGVCVTIYSIASGATASDKVIATSVCDKRGAYRIALPPGDYLLKSRRDSNNKSVVVRVKSGTFQWGDLSVIVEVP
jgi:hypothetical protein